MAVGVWCERGEFVGVDSGGARVGHEILSINEEREVFGFLISRADNPRNL